MISWGGRQKWGFCSYVSSIAMKKSDLRSSCKNGKVTCWFYAFERSMLTDKSKEGCLRRWTLKRFLWFLRIKLDSWIDFSLSFILVISQFIQGNFQRKNVRLIFLIILFKCILIILLLFFFFFWFNRGYIVNDRLDFALSVIKRRYNTNDRLKFILSFIRWETI